MTTALTPCPTRCRSLDRVSPSALLLVLTALFWNGCSGGNEEAAPAAANPDAAAVPAEGQPPAEGPPGGPGLPGGPGMPGGPPMPEEMAAALNQNAPATEEPAEPGKAPFDTTFLDVNTEVFVFARVADILKSSLVQTLTGGNLAPLEDMEREVGINPGDVASVTVGIRNLAKLSTMQSLPTGMTMPGAGAGVQPGFGQISPPPAGAGALPEAGIVAGPAGTPPLPEDTATSPQLAGQPSSLDQRLQDVVAVVRTASAVDVEIFEREHVERVPHGKSAFYRLTSPEGEKMLVYLHDPQTLVVSDEATIKQIIDEGEMRPRPTADLGFVETAPHLMVGVVPKDPAALFRQNAMLYGGPGMAPMLGGPGMAPMPGGPLPGATPSLSLSGKGKGKRDDDGEGLAPPPGTAADSLPTDSRLLSEHTKALAVLVDLSAGTTLRVALNCDTPEAAQGMQKVIDATLEEARMSWDASKSSLPGMIQQVAQPVVDALATQTAGSVVSVSTTLPEDQHAKLSMLPTVMMGMMMGGMDLSAMTVVNELSREEAIQEVRDEGQAAANTAEIPQGIEVKALARWGESRYGEQAPAPLEVNVIAVGGPAAQAVAWGKLTLSEAKATEASALKWEGASPPTPTGDPITATVPVDRNEFAKHPDDGVGFGILLVPPVEATKALASVTGQFTLVAPSQTQDVLVANVAGLSDGVVPNKELAAAEMIATFDEQGRLVVTYSASQLIGVIEPVTANGEAVESSVTTRDHGGGSRSLMFTLNQPAPADLALRVATHGDMQEVVIPFRFENLTLPEPQQLTDEQRSLLVWTRGDTPSDHPDLTIEAQGRWRTLELAEVADSDFGSAMPGPFGAQFGAGGGIEPGGTAADSYSLPNPSTLTNPAGATPGGAGLLGNRKDKKDRGRDDDDVPQPGQLAPAGLPEPEGPGGANFGTGFGGGGSAAAGSDQPLQIVIDLIGPLVESTESLGKLTVSSVKSDLDTDVAFEGAELLAADENPVDEFVDVDETVRTAADHPPHGLRLVVKLTPPQTPIGALALLNGSVTLRTVREQSTAILSDLQSRVGTPAPGEQMAVKPVSDRELIKHGLKPVIALEANRVMMRLLEGRDEKISEVKLLDLNGKPITDVQATVEAGTPQTKGHQIYMFTFANPVPQKIGMKISVNLGVKDVEIPIRIRNLPVPPLPNEAG